ncbi:MAG: phosphatidylglycerol lysyltransferase domain-containing protein, partial [Bifidobacteriaceae bacterium]|nr:phosphatidylglycerol lysyltransferase domain-containing protein [Bifidobacteriaceae bacterium]
MPPVPVPSPWWRRVPGWAGNIARAAAIWALLGGIVAPVVPGLSVVATWVWGLVGLPANPSLVNAALLFVLAEALARRKRAGLIAAVVLVEGPAALYGFGVVIAHVTGADVGRSLSLATSADVSLGTSLAIHAASAVGSLAVIVVLLAARRAFPARVPHLAFARALAVVVLAAAVAGTVAYIPARPIAQVVSAVSALGVVLAFIVFTRSTATAIHPITASEEVALRRLLPAADSLSYFATRRDKSVVFASDSRAAIAFRQIGGVLLASGDPVGDGGSWADAIARFVALARRSGWTAAVVGTSADGALA